MTESRVKVLDDSALYARLKRAAERGEDLSAPLDVEAVVARWKAERAAPIEIEGELVDDELVFSLPRPTTAPLAVNGNEITVGEQRLVVQWKGVRREAA